MGGFTKSHAPQGTNRDPEEPAPIGRGDGFGTVDVHAAIRDVTDLGFGVVGRSHAEQDSGDRVGGGDGGSVAAANAGAGHPFKRPAVQYAAGNL